MLAGDVLAVVDDGNLIISGDAESNQIAVDQSDLAAGEVRISGLDGTTINGEAGPVVLPGVTGDVEADLDDGDDVVIFDQVVVDGDLKIDMGDGIYQVTLIVDVGGDVKFSSDDSFAEDVFTAPSLTIGDSTFWLHDCRRFGDQAQSRLRSDGNIQQFRRG